MPVNKITMVINKYQFSMRKKSLKAILVIFLRYFNQTILIEVLSRFNKKLSKLNRRNWMIQIKNKYRFKLIKVSNRKVVLSYNCLS